MRMTANRVLMRKLVDNLSRNISSAGKELDVYRDAQKLLNVAEEELQGKKFS